MNKRLFAASFLAPAVLLVCAPSVSAQTDPRSILEKTIEPDALVVAVGAPALDMSLRMHDDWPLASFNVSNAADMSLRMHDDWPLARVAVSTSLDLSPRPHDDWALESR